jgi:hypothetical protein
MDAAPHVHWKSFEELETSLRELSGRYAESAAEERKELRATVIKSKDRARSTSRNSRVSEAKRAEKAEMVEWMLVWLGDPAMFGEWVALRKARLDGGATESRSAAGR